MRGRPLGRFGTTCVSLPSTWVEPSARRGVAGCLPFPFAGARFLGVGRVALEGSLRPSPSPFGGFEERPPSTLSIAFALPFLRTSYLALHWTTRVGTQDGEEKSTPTTHRTIFSSISHLLAHRLPFTLPKLFNRIH